MSIEMNNEFRSFSYEEYKMHNQKLQHAMQEFNMDALLLSSPENIYYATGYRSWYTSSLFRPVFVLVPREGDPTIILRILEKSTVKLTSWTPNICCLGNKARNLGNLDADTLNQALNQFLSKQASTVQTIGIEAGDGLHYYWSLNILEDMIDSQPSIKFIDGTRTIQKARMIKTEWEINKIRQACHVTEKAIIETFKEIKPGLTTEKEISCGIASRMTAGGIDKISYLTVTSGIQKYTTFNAYATDRVVQFGENVLVDISGHIDGYASDLTRVIHLGKKAPTTYQEMADVASKSVFAGFQALKPGIRACELNQVVEDYIRNSKYGDYLVHSSGHGVGLNVVEYPTLDETNTEVIQPGMVFAIENGIYPYAKEEGAENIYLSFRMEDEAVVTEHGAEWLSGPGKPLYTLDDFYY